MNKRIILKEIIRQTHKEGITLDDLIEIKKQYDQVIKDMTSYEILKCNIEVGFEEYEKTMSDSLDG